MSPHFGRRDFIRLGGLGMALVPLAGGRSAHARGMDEGARHNDTIPTGYWLGSEERADPEHWTLAGGETALVSATAIPPDPGLDGGAAVTVHGLAQAPPAWHSPALQDLSLTTHYVLPDLADSDGIDFQAWSYERGPVTNDGSPIRFEVPTGPGVDLSLTLERETARPGLGRRLVDMTLAGAGAAPSPPSPARVHLRLTSDPTPGTPKLRRGVYFLAVGDRPRWTRVAWEEYRFRPTPDAGATMLARIERLVSRGAAPAGFDYLVISIDRPAAGA